MSSFLEKYEIDRARELTRISANLFMQDLEFELDELQPYWQDCPWISHADWLLKKLLPANWMTTHE